MMIPSDSFDEIYNFIAVESLSCARTHKNVMGFILGSHLVVDGGITIWWEPEYVSLENDIAKDRIVDWMHEQDMLIDKLFTLRPIEGYGQGLLATWHHIDGTTYLSDRVFDFVERMNGGSVTAAEAEENRSIEDGAGSE